MKAKIVVSETGEGKEQIEIASFRLSLEGDVVRLVAEKLGESTDRLLEVVIGPTCPFLMPWSQSEKGIRKAKQNLGAKLVKVLNGDQSALKLAQALVWRSDIGDSEEDVDIAQLDGSEHRIETHSAEVVFALLVED